MEDLSGNSKWLWILGAGALVIAIVGLVLAISAKNSAVDTDQVVSEATGQLKEELSGLNGAIKASEELQNEQQQQSARDRKRINRQVDAAVQDTEKRLNKINSEVKELQVEAADSTESFAALEKEVDELRSEQRSLETQVQKLKERLNNQGL